MKKKIALALVLLLSFLLVPAAAAGGGLENFRKTKTYTAGQFSDVPANAWYAGNVKEAYETGLVLGTSTSKFSPSGNMTIAEAVTLAARLHSIYYTGEADFKQGNPWYQTYVDYVIREGIIAAGAYTNYNAKATRENFAVIMGRALPDEALKAVNQVENNGIPDVPSNHRSAADIYRLYRAGILTGTDKFGNFKPNSNIQRSEVAALVTRMANPTLRKPITLFAENALAYNLAQSIIQLFKDACNESSYDVIESNAKYKACRIPAMEEYFTFGGNFYYAYYDINKDGVSELLFRNNDCIAAVYTYFNGTYYNFFGNAEPLYARNRLTIFTDGTMCVQGSAGASDYSYTFYRLEYKDGEMYRVKTAYYHVTESGIYNAYGQRVNMTYDDLDAMLASYKEASITWTHLAHNTAYDIRQEIEAFMNKGDIFPLVFPFLMYSYTDVRKIPLADIVRYGPDSSLKYSTVSNAYKKATGWLDGDLIYNSSSELDSYLKKYTGYGLYGYQGSMAGLTYLSGLKAYCLQVWDTEAQTVSIKSTSISGSTVTVVYTNSGQYNYHAGEWYYYTTSGNWGKAKQMKLTLKRLGSNNYQFISNLPA
ncbi:MAG: S-layer homology domain-containing protein [Oscillospiraceae bacterium]|nr:S-layer homology domain-containing protein [Oscillospiraceae bacterium]